MRSSTGNIDAVSKKEINIILYPYELRGNAFVEIKKRMLADNGVKCYCMKEVITKPMMLRRIEAVDFNWFETLHSDSLLKCFLILTAKLFIILFMKANGIKIIYTIHNKKSHNKSIGLGLEKFLRKVLLLTSDAIVILCNQTRQVIKNEYTDNLLRSIENKIWVQYHPNYLNYYKEPTKNDMLDLEVDPQCMVLLSLGGISPYKNIEMVIEVAKCFVQYPIVFLIAGSCEEEYKKKLWNKIQGYNKIVLHTEFIPDDEILKYVCRADAMLLPYHIDSSLNSGACILGLTYGKNIICPEIGTTKEFPPGLLYTYTYNDEVEHKGKLKATIQKAYFEWKNDTTEYIRKEIDLQEIMKKEYDQNLLGKNYRTMLEKVVN